MGIAAASIGEAGISGGAAAAGSTTGEISAGASTTGEATAGSTGGSGISSSTLDLISPASYASMGSEMASREEGQRQFDMTFYENKRRFGMDFALRETALRHNASYDRLKMMFQGRMEGLGTVQNMRQQSLERRQAEMGIAETQRKKRVSQKFMQGFNKMIKAPTEPGRMDTGGK